MGLHLPSGANPLFLYETLKRQWKRMLNKWEPQLDRLEDFAANVGMPYTDRAWQRLRHSDVGLVALCSGALALLGLLFL